MNTNPSESLQTIPCVKSLSKEQLAEKRKKKFEQYPFYMVNIQNGTNMHEGYGNGSEEALPKEIQNTWELSFCTLRNGEYLRAAVLMNEKPSFDEIAQAFHALLLAYIEPTHAEVKTSAGTQMLTGNEMYTPQLKERNLKADSISNLVDLEKKLSDIDDLNERIKAEQKIIDLLTDATKEQLAYLLRSKNIATTNLTEAIRSEALARALEL